MTPEFWRTGVQTMARDKLRALQDERLRALVARIFEQPVPFFRAKLEGAGLGPDDVKSVDDLAKVPPTIKDELRADEAAHPPFGSYRGAPVEACVRISTSTGTSGKPTFTLFTQHDLDVEYDAGCRSFHRQGRRPGEIVTHAHPGGLNGGQALLGGVIEKFGCLNVPVGPPRSKDDVARAISLWQELRPHHYELFGPVLRTFWDGAIAAGLDPERDLNMKPPADVAPFRTVSAGLDCFAFLGSSCAQERGAHVCEDEAIVEAVDPATGEPVPDGERGHLVVTSLTKDNAMLRYDLEDVVHVERDACACGETHLRAFWWGRAKDATRAAGKDVLPNDVINALRDMPGVAEPTLEFQIVRTADMSALRVRVEAPSDSVRGDVRARLEERIGVPVSVEVLAPGALPRPFYKPAQVVDE